MTFDPKLPWAVVPHAGSMFPATTKPIAIVDADENTIACNTTYYPTEISEEHANFIVERVNAGGKKTITIDLATTLGTLKASPDLGKEISRLVFGDEQATAIELAEELTAALRAMVDSSPVTSNSDFRAAYRGAIYLLSRIGK